jgi:hypothetical protein
MSVILLGLLTMPLTFASDYASLPNATSRTRTETMPFGQCISLVDDVAVSLNANPITVLRTTDVRIVRIEAEDGVVILSCDRAEGRMVLTKRPK